MHTDTKTPWTPGPWNVSYDSSIHASDGGYVAEAYDGRNGPVNDDAAGKANARLIAVAPDLIATLESAVYHLDAAMRETGWSDAEEFVKDARALIARARGDAQ